MENVMAVYTWHDPCVEILGAQLQNFVRCAQPDDITPILSKYALTNVQTDRWYPVQLWLNVMTDIAAAQNGMMNLTSLGMKMADVVFSPPEFARGDFEAVFMHLNRYYQRYLRNGDVGHQRTLKVAERHLLAESKIPYPDDLLYGMLYGLTRRYLPPETQFILYYDDVTLRRDLGGEWTRIHVEWA